LHETSIVKTLLKQVDEVVQQNDAHAVRKVSVEIGPLSGVETELVRSAFAQLAPQTTSANAKLEIVEIGLQIRCRHCQTESEINDFVFRCPDCGSGEVQVTDGDCVRLQSVTLVGSAEEA
jgi:hydrogenase nickel incorporation protein HypA/HybF